MSENTHGNLNEIVNAQFNNEPQSNAEAVKEIYQNQETQEVAEQKTIPTEENESNSEENIQFSKKFAALSRKEKALRERESELELRLQELEQKIQQNQQPKEVEIPLEQRLKRNPLETLNELGLGYDTLTELALNDGKLSSDMQLKLMRDELESKYQSKFEEIENRLYEKELQEQEARTNNIINDFKQEVHSIIDNNSDKYELIKATGSEEMVYEYIANYAQEYNEVINTEEAAQIVEDILLEEAKKIQNVNKLKALNEPSKPQQTQRQSPITLSNTHSAQVSQQADRKLSEQESKDRMAQMLQWTE